MTNDRFDMAVATWLSDEARHRIPDHLDAILAVTARTRQRPAWSSLERWLPMDTTLRPVMPNVRPAPVLVVGAIILALVGLIVVAVGSRPRVPEPFGAAANGSIAYWLGGDIYIAEADGTDGRPIVTGSTDDFAPWYSHDGTRFAFWRQSALDRSDVMVADADGSDVRYLTDEPLILADWFEWSPDDTLIAVIHTVGKVRAMTILDAVGSAPARTFTLDGLSVDNALYWRPPSGEELIFSATLTNGNSRESGLYIIRSDGSNLRQLAPPAEDRYWDLAVSPDGMTLAFASVDPDDSSNGKGVHLHTLDLATGTDRSVTFDPEATDEHGPVFSPDGQAVLLWRELGSVVGNAQLMVADLSSEAPGVPLGQEFKIGDLAGYGFAPDGTTVFAIPVDGLVQIIDIATGQVSVLDPAIRNVSSWQRLAR
jgi:dipeptidyl aminopeptidase/acylaminoacyl peptidase